MKKRRLLAVVPAAFVALSGTSVANADPAPPSPPPTTNIVGGVPASETYSFMVSLQNSSGRHSCGGSLIDASQVVTAATCATSPAIYGDVTAYRSRIMQIIGTGAAANA